MNVTYLCRGVSGALLVPLLCVCGQGGSMNMSGGITNEDMTFPADVVTASNFAQDFYSPLPCDVQPSMQPTGLPIDPDHVMNLEQMVQWMGTGTVPPELISNGFCVVRPFWATDNPVRAFETVAGWDQPVYVSSGIPLHMLHIFFDQILQRLEEEHFRGDLLQICSALYSMNLQRNCHLNAGFYAVPLALLDPGFSPDPSVAEDVRAELDLIREHSGFSLSPLMGYREDYSQYVPRGHYTASQDLESYFMAMMWLGRLTFLLNGGEPHGPMEDFLVSEEDAAYMTGCALLTVSDLQIEATDGEMLLDKWLRIYEVTAFFAGFADDLSVPQYASAGAEVAGEDTDTDTIMSMEFYRRFRDYVSANFGGPSIYSGTGGLVSMPDETGDFDPGDLETAMSTTMGFRFMGQRYTPDSDILGKLVFPSVGMNDQGERRFMPTGLDVAAAFGSPAAMELLRQRGDFQFGNYSDSLDSLSAMIDSYGPDDWHATLYMSWLHCLRLLMAPRGEGYPDFMQTDAWDMHTLSNFLASWAMLRHDTILYAKQSYTMEAGCAPGPFQEPPPSAGFVEPVPQVYAELNATLDMAMRGLSHFGLLEGDIEGRFANAKSLMTRLQGIAEGELAGVEMSSDDADFLKSFASYLESAICWDGETTEGLETSLIADVHTDQNSSSVLEVASGNLDLCFVVYRRPDGYIEVAAGPVLSYYEFTWPMSDRLTDEAWRRMLGSSRPPESPAWEPIIPAAR